MTEVSFVALGEALIHKQGGIAATHMAIFFVDRVVKSDFDICELL
jgi:hypothetical protein